MCNYTGISFFVQYMHTESRPDHCYCVVRGRNGVGGQWNDSVGRNCDSFLEQTCFTLAYLHVHVHEGCDHRLRWYVICSCCAVGNA